MSAPRKPPLEDYRKKRDPARTPEPFSEAAPSAPVGAPPRFVVQKHWARNLHYDLRLELDGVLKSWAVPKGPSTKVEEKRLAVHVEDHPLEYIDFEGVIPADNYGAGSVIVWDRGAYGSFKPEPLMEQYERGKMELELFGFKLRGRWTLVRMGKKDKEWLLLKKDDGAASEREAIDRYPESVITGLTVEETRDVPGTLAALGERVRSLKAPRAEVPVRKVALTLATLADVPPNGPEWSFEIKYDGVRVLAERDGDAVTMLGRSGEEITKRYPEVAAALRTLPARRFVLDGEIIAEDAAGRPSFQRLQARMGLVKPRDIEAAMLRVPVRGAFFDLLALDGHDLRKLPLAARQELLARVVPPLATAQRSAHILAHGAACYEAASEMGLEGIVAKKLTSTYSGRRTPEWLKIKCQKRQEFVIGGWTEPQGSRARFGALHIGLYDAGRLVYVTKVGTGFDGAGIEAIAKRLEPLARDTSPFEVDSPKGREHHWVEPRLVCEVRFTEWTNAGGLRHPTFLGTREDKRPEECVREHAMAYQAEAGAEPDPPAEAASDPAPRKGSRAKKSAAAKAAGPPRAPAAPASAPAPTRVALTNLKKVFWPEGYTKGDLIAYYEAAAPYLLPYLRDRPIVLTRYPDGIAGKSFFQKDAPVFVPDWVRTETIDSGEGRPIRYFVIDDLDSLRYIANLGTIPIHAWSARVGALERPDWMVIDLDPKKAPFTHVVQVARATHTVLEELALPSWIKTSGASGLHIMIPMGQRYSHEETRTFARLLAMLVVERVPEISTVTRTVEARGGKVYVDFGQNGHGITIASTYCVRPLPGAPVSCPLRWDEVTARLDPRDFTIQTMPPRLGEVGDLLDGVLGKGIDIVKTIAALEKRVTPTSEKPQKPEKKKGRKT